MSKTHCDKSQKVCAVSAVSLGPQSMLMQLAMPLDPRDTIKARRERAIRRSGLTPSKGFRLWCGVAELWRWMQLLKRHLYAAKGNKRADEAMEKFLSDAKRKAYSSANVDQKAKPFTKFPPPKHITKLTRE
jgi:hypothetical protein